MAKFRVVHYVNQFFGQIGGEDKAGITPQFKNGLTGAGQLLQKTLGEEYEVVLTVICGDNYAAEHPDEAISVILPKIKEANPDILIAGPAFASGRYGTACALLCQAIQQKLNIPAVSAMHPVNPGVDMARKDVYIIEAGESTLDMKRAMEKMAALAKKLVKKQTIGLPSEEGYLPRGVRLNVRVEKRASKRAVEMLLKKLHGEPFTTELPIPVYDHVPPAPPIKDVSKALIALVTEGGIVPLGNPDRIEAHNASKYCKYPIAGLDDFKGGEYQTCHGGYDPTFANEDPDRILPLDATRLLEKDGAFGKLYDYYYVTVGNVTAVLSAARYGREIGKALLEAGVQGVILTAT
jgi:glycine reductase complex component B subunit gamma